MYYGKFGLVDYTKCGYRKLSDEDFLDYYSYPVFDNELDTIIRSCKRNLFSVYSSIWRMISDPVNGVNHPDTTHFDKVKRRVEAVYLDDLLPNVLYDKAWKDNYLELFQALSNELKQLDSVCRNASIRFVICLPKDVKLDSYVAKILLKLWDSLGYPKTNKNVSVSYRLFIHSSSLPKDLGKATNLLNKLPKLHDKLCIIADDQSFYSVMMLCKEFKYKIRPSFDIEEARTKKGKRINIKGKEWKVFENFWRADKNGSVYLPIVFCSKPVDEESTEKLLRHYVRKSSVVFY